FENKNVPIVFSAGRESDASAIRRPRWKSTTSLNNGRPFHFIQFRISDNELNFIRVVFFMAQKQTPPIWRPRFGPNEVIKGSKRLNLFGIFWFCHEHLCIGCADECGILSSSIS